MHRALVALGVLASAAVAAPVPKALKAKVPNLDGTWELVQQNNNGTEVEKISPWRWEISGEELHRHWGNGDGSFRRENQNCWLVRPDNDSPDAVDYITGFNRKSETYKARVSISGDEMVVCWLDGGDGRPTEMKPADGVDYYRFKRVSDK